MWPRRPDCTHLVNSLVLQSLVSAIESHWERYVIDQFRYIKIQPNTVDLSARLWGINSTNSSYSPEPLRSIVLGWILIYQNCSIRATVKLHALMFSLFVGAFNICILWRHSTESHVASLIGQYTVVNFALNCNAHFYWT